MVRVTLLWSQFRSEEMLQPMCRSPMMTNCGPDRHQLQQHNDHNVMGRVEGLKLAQVVAILNINGVRVVVCLLGSFHHTRQPKGRLLFRGQ